MNRKVEQVISVGLVLLFLVGCSSLATPSLPTATSIPPTTTPTPMGPSRIEGRVFRSDMAKPIACATIALYDAASDKKIAETATDEQGQYSFVDVKPGTYWMTITWRFEFTGEALCSDLGFKPSSGGTTFSFAQAYKASEVYQGEERPYGVDPNLLVISIGPFGLNFAQIYKTSEVGVPLYDLKPDLDVKAYGPFGFIFGRYYKTGELGIPLSGLDPNLETLAVDFKSDGGVCLIFGTSYKASELGVQFSDLDPSLLVQGVGFSSDGQVRFTFGTSYKIGELGISPEGLDPNLETSGIAITKEGWYIIGSVESEDAILLNASGIEQQFTVLIGDVLQKDLDLSYP